MTRKQFPLAIVLATTACTNSEGREQKIMNAIEAKVEMPGKGLSLDRYVRVYAPSSDRTVIGAFYASGPAGFDLNEVCFDGGHKVSQCGSRQIKNTKLMPGQRLWIDHVENLPDVSGGGCGYIRVQYDLQSQRITRTECNGPY